MKKITIFVAILLLGIVLRFLWLDSIPNNLTMDEVNNGYTAYSLLKTGNDEWGQRLPILFRSVGDFKPPILIYLTVPSVAIFGLNEFAVRFPVALLSLIAMIVVYFLSKKHLFSQSPKWVHFFNMFLFATSPWMIIYSRSGYEAIVALSFFLINIYLLLEYFDNRKPILLFLSLLFAFLSAFTYHSFKLLVPLMNLALIALSWKQVLHIGQEIRKNKLIFSLILTFFILATIFFIKFFIFGPGSVRAKMVFISVDFEFNIALMERIRELSYGILNLPMLIFFWFKRYLDYFTPNFYLYSGSELTIPGHPGAGVTGIAVYILFLSGLARVLFSNSKDQTVSKKAKFILIIWLLFGFLPASLANNIQQPLRSVGASPSVLLISGMGLLTLVEILKNKLIRNLAILILLGIFTLDYIRFADFYLIHYPQELSEYRHYGWKQMYEYVSKVKDQYDNIYVDPRYGSIGRTTYSIPHLYFLFYSKYDPQTFQSSPLRKEFIGDFDKFKFLDIDWQGINKQGVNLYVASPWSFPDILKKDPYILYEVKFLNGVPALYAISNQNLPK